jgi:hypothetical protein
MLCVEAGKSVFTRLETCRLIMYTTWFFFSFIVLCLAFIGGDEITILVWINYLLVISGFTKVSLITYCSYPCLRLLAQHRHKQWMHPWSQPSSICLSCQSIPVVISLGNRWWMLLVSPERTSSCSRPAAGHQLWLWGNSTLFNPSGFIFIVGADGDLLCVLAKGKE